MMSEVGGRGKGAYSVYQSFQGMQTPTFLGNSGVRETGGVCIELCRQVSYSVRDTTFLNSNFHVFPGKTEAAIKNFSPYYLRQYSVAFCNHVRSEVEQQRDLASQFLKTKVSHGHLVYIFLPLKNAL